MNHDIPTRGEVPAAHRWNLSRLFPDDESWEKGLEASAPPRAE